MNPSMWQMTLKVNSRPFVILSVQVLVCLLDCLFIVCLFWLVCLSLCLISTIWQVAMKVYACLCICLKSYILSKYLSACLGILTFWLYACLYVCLLLDCMFFVFLYFEVSNEGWSLPVCLSVRVIGLVIFLSVFKLFLPSVSVCRSIFSVCNWISKSKIIVFLNILFLDFRSVCRCEPISSYRRRLSLRRNIFATKQHLIPIDGVFTDTDKVIASANLCLLCLEGLLSKKKPISVLVL